MIGLAIASQKGGVGKTTVALNTAFSLARRGWRTLVVDTDPAGAVGLSLTRKLAESPGLSEYVGNSHGLSQVLVQTKLRELSILPVGRVAPTDAMRFQTTLSDGVTLKKLLAEVDGRYDVVVFDTPSGFGGSTLGALAASRFVLCPVQSEPIAARSVLRVLDLIGSLRTSGVDIQLLGFLLTMIAEADASSAAVAADLRKNLPGQLLIEVGIPRHASFLEASASGVPVGLLRRRAPISAIAFDQLAVEIEAKMGLKTGEREDDPIALVD